MADRRDVHYSEMDEGGLMLAPGGAVQSLGKGLSNIFRLKTTREGGPDYVIPPDPTPEAMEIAQKNAAKPVEEGGLGLPPDNTSIDRAKAMGYGIPFYHGTIDEILSIEPFRNKAGFFGANEPPEVAETYAFDPLEQVFGSGMTNIDDSKVYTLLMRDDALAKVKDPKSPARVGKIDWGGYNFDNSQEAYLDLPNGEQIEFNNISTDDLEDIAKEYDLDAIEITQIRDIANQGFPGTKEALQEAEYLSTPGTSIPTASGMESVAFNQGLVRAPNAAFDPAKRGSASLTAGLSGTAIALGLVATPEEAEAAYIPLRAFAEGSEAAKALFERAMKRIDEGADTRPNGELYNEMGVYRSEDGDLKVDLAELKARDVESTQAVARFNKDIGFYLDSDVKRRKKFEFPLTRYIPENSPIFENFPELADTTVKIKPKPKDSNTLGEYGDGEIIIYVDKERDYSEFTEERTSKFLEAFNTLVHEFQHYIQDVKKSANTGYNQVATGVGLRGFREDYDDAVSALERLQPGEIGYDQFKNKVDSMHDLIGDAISTEARRKEFKEAPIFEQVKTARRVLDNFQNTAPLKGDELWDNYRLGYGIYIRELGEAEARSAGMKALLPEGAERTSIGVFYPKTTGYVTLEPGDVRPSDQLDPTHVLVRATPAYEEQYSKMGKLYYPEIVMGQDIPTSSAVADAKTREDIGTLGKKGPAAAVAGAGTAAGLASPPSEAFVAGIGERTGLFEDGSPTPSLFDVEGVSDELGISNTFLLDLLVPRTKPYDLISNIPGIGETMMATDAIDYSFGNYLRGEGTEAGQRIRAEANKDSTEMRQGGGIETEAGKEMAKEKFQLDERKADLDKDGKLSAYEKARGEAIQRAMGEGKETKMAMGGMMGMMADPFAPLQVTVDIDEESGNEVPAGSKEEEVRDDIPAMLSEGEYVVPADVVRWHGLKKFEELRCEAKNALGLMAMHDRISFVDDDTKEPVEYDIKEKDLPEVEEAEVEVIEAAEGTDVQPATEPTTFYQLQYKTDPVTGQVRIVYVDPLTGQEVKREEYEEERASRFAPQRLLEREVYAPGEEAAEEEEEETEPTQCPPGQIFDSYSGKCVPFNQEGDGEGREDTSGPGRYGMSEEGFTLEDGTQVRSTDAIYSRIDPSFNQYLGKAPGSQLPGYLGVIASVGQKIGKELKEIEIAKSIRSGDYLGITPSTPDYGDWRNNMAEDLAASVAESEFEARDVVSGDRDFGGSSFGSRDEAQAVADHGWGSDEHFDSIEAGFDANTDQDGGGREGTDLGDAGDTSDNEGPSGGEASNPAGDVDSGPGSGFGYAKGGMPVRKNTPLVKMMKY